MLEEGTEQEAVSQAARLMGQRKSDHKAMTSAANGKLGGRPKGTPQSEETKAKISASRRKQAQGEGEASA